MGRLARAPVGLLSPSIPPAYAPLPRLPLLKRFSRSRFSRNVPSGMPPPLSDADVSDLRRAVSVPMPYMRGCGRGSAIRCTIPLSTPTLPVVALTTARVSSGSPFGPSPRPCSDWVPVWLPGYCTQAFLCLPPLRFAICSWPPSAVCAAELSFPGGCPPGPQPLLSPGLPGLLVGLVCMCRDVFPSSHYRKA